MYFDQNKRNEMRDKIKGVIFGTALGDAVGLATEFMLKDEVKMRYGGGPIKFGRANGYDFYRDAHRERWKENDFTDDTDQLLLILQCILSTNGCLVPEHFANRLKEWMNVGFPELDKLCYGIGKNTFNVVEHSAFPKDPHKAAYEIWAKQGYSMAANGAVMRTAVLGIPHFFHEKEVVLNAIQCAKVTHADPRCIFSSVVVSALISRILRKALGIEENYEVNQQEKEELLKIVDSKKTAHSIRKCDSDEPSVKELCKPKPLLKRAMKPVYPKFPDEALVTDPEICSTNSKKFSTASCGADGPSMKLMTEVIAEYKFLLKNSSWKQEVDKLCFANSLDELDLDEKTSIGYTFKCLGSGLFCFSRRKPVDMKDEDFFKEVITELILEGGDADTNAAVAGALLGCRLGMHGLPSDWWKGIRNLNFLTKISDELTELVTKQVDSVLM